MNFDERYEIVEALYCALDSARDNAARLGLKELAKEIDAMNEPFQEELSRMDEILEKQAAAELECMNREYERSVL